MSGASIAPDFTALHTGYQRPSGTGKPQPSLSLPRRRESSEESGPCSGYIGFLVDALRSRQQASMPVALRDLPWPLTVNHGNVQARRCLPHHYRTLSVMPAQAGIHPPRSTLEVPSDIGQQRQYVDPGSTPGMTVFLRCPHSARHCRVGGNPPGPEYVGGSIGH